MSVQIEDVGKQLKESLGTDIAIIDKYGFIIYSTIQGFEKNTILSTTVLDFISERVKVSEELKSEPIDSITFSTKNKRYIFSFSSRLILMCILNENISLDKLLPGIKKFLSLLDMVHYEIKLDDMIDISISKEIEDIENRIKELAKLRENKFEIFKEIVKHINQLQNS